MTKLQQLTQYMKDTWIDSTMWLPATWSVYCQPVRTNNDAEDWHHRLNSRAHHSGLNMYLLLSLLKHEADMVAINVKLLSDKKVRKRQHKSTIRVQAWMEYQTGTRSIKRLLNACARLYAPSPQQQN